MIAIHILNNYGIMANGNHDMSAYSKHSLPGGNFQSFIQSIPDDGRRRSLQMADERWKIRGHIDSDHHHDQNYW